MQKCYHVYVWLKEDGVTPYFVSFCETTSKAIFKHKHGIECPSNPKLIQVLFQSHSQDECVEFLERYTFVHGLENDGSKGTLKNSVYQPIASLKNSHHPKARAVDVYNLSGEFLGTFGSLGHACSAFDLNQGNAHGALSGRFYQTGGYILKPAGEKIEIKEYKQQPPRYRKVFAYSPEGEIFEFSSLGDAAKHVYGESRRGNTGPINKSICSPTKDKTSAMGWVFFDPTEEIPPHDHIVRKRRGRRKKTVTN